MPDLPAQCRIVVIGGGAIGASIACCLGDVGWCRPGEQTPNEFVSLASRGDWNGD